MLAGLFRPQSKNGSAIAVAAVAIAVAIMVASVVMFGRGMNACAGVRSYTDQCRIRQRGWRLAIFQGLKLRAETIARIRGILLLVCARMKRTLRRAQTKRRGDAGPVRTLLGG